MNDTPENAVKYQRYDDSKWTIPLYGNVSSVTESILISYLQDKLLPFPQSILFKDSPTNQQLLIYAETIGPLLADATPSLFYSDFYRLLGDITSQLHYYENHGYVHVGFDVHDIVQIRFSDNTPSKFVILNDKYVCKIHPYNKMDAQIIYVSGTGPHYCSPEIVQNIANKRFPITIHIHAGYYGFGKYMEYILTFCHGLASQTKICGFLERCFHPNEDVRTLLYL